MSGAITTNALDAGTQLELEAAMAELRRGGGTIVRMADLLGRFVGRAGDGLLRRVGLSTLMRIRARATRQAPTPARSSSSSQSSSNLSMGRSVRRADDGWRAPALISA